MRRHGVVPPAGFEPAISALKGLRPGPLDDRGVAFDYSRLLMVCWHTMKRTTVKLPDELDATLRLEAQRRRTTVSELTRQAIEAFLGKAPRRRLLGAGAGHSGRSDISERAEEILREEMGR